MLTGLDYVLVSYFEGDCGAPRSDWTAAFQDLRAPFPNAGLGFGEVGYTDKNANDIASQNLGAATIYLQKRRARARRAPGPRPRRRGRRSGSRRGGQPSRVAGGLQARRRTVGCPHGVATEPSRAPAANGRVGAFVAGAGMGGTLTGVGRRLKARTFEIDVLHCDRCQGWMRLVALVLEDENIARLLRTLGEPTSLPARAPSRGPPYWQSRVLRRASGDDTAA